MWRVPICVCKVATPRLGFIPTRHPPLPPPRCYILVLLDDSYLSLALGTAGRAGDEGGAALFLGSVLGRPPPLSGSPPSTPRSKLLWKYAAAATTLSHEHLWEY